MTLGKGWATTPTHGPGSVSGSQSRVGSSANSSATKKKKLGSDSMTSKGRERTLISGLSESWQRKANY
jgi:hypothetical protein